MSALKIKGKTDTRFTVESLKRNNFFLGEYFFFWYQKCSRQLYVTGGAISDIKMGHSYSVNNPTQVLMAIANKNEVIIRIGNADADDEVALVIDSINIRFAGSEESQEIVENMDVCLFR